jgi:hypothetical protein
VLKPDKTHTVKTDLDKRRERLLVKQAIARIERAEYERSIRFNYLDDEFELVARRGCVGAKAVA